MMQVCQMQTGLICMASIDRTSITGHDKMTPCNLDLPLSCCLGSPCFSVGLLHHLYLGLLTLLRTLLALHTRTCSLCCVQNSVHEAADR